MEVDRWGNFKFSPAKIIEEIREGNFVKIFLYEYEGGFYYGYQLKLGGVVKQKAANKNDAALGTADAARIHACMDITKIGMANRSIRAIFTTFDKVRYNQPTLFDEE
jgi:hypothetical protein